MRERFCVVGTCMCSLHLVCRHGAVVWHSNVTHYLSVSKENRENRHKIETVSMDRSLLCMVRAKQSAPQTMKSERCQHSTALSAFSRSDFRFSTIVENINSAPLHFQAHSTPQHPLFSPTMETAAATTTTSGSSEASMGELAALVDKIFDACGALTPPPPNQHCWPAQKIAIFAL